MTAYIPQARELGITGCVTCGLVVRLSPRGENRCPRCHSHLHARKPNSIQTTWALLLTAALLYIPANVLPVMTVTYLGSGQPDTIISGVVHLFDSGMWPLGLIVFVASIVVPLLKLVTLAYLLVSLQRKPLKRRRRRTRLFRLTELVGRWSMVDVFVIALLTTLVQMGSIASVEPGLGASAFAAVVILTMFAAMSFDPRLIWEQRRPDDGA